MRVLIATNQLERLSGSEIVALEFAEFFKQKGHQVDVFANYRGLPIRLLFKESGIIIETDPKNIRPMCYDLVYFQHHVAGLFSYEAHENDVESSIFAFGHLSPTGFFESGGWAHESILADVTLANSPETATALAQTGLTVPVRVFHNAAPDTFHAKRTGLRATPGKILFVTNHSTPVCLEAIEILKADFDVLHIGRGGDKVARVNRRMIREADIVVTIGKTVQYALAVGTPVYVYDHFGGPGYLSEENFQWAAAFNFSGRCHGRKLSGEALAADILAGYGGSRKFTLAMSEEKLAPYRLSSHLEALLAIRPGSNADRRARLAARLPEVERERLLASHVRTAYNRERRLSAEIDKLTAGAQNRA
ncbi:glycosyltransferase family protein [Roseixanthobacter glucoisosaccharinicivorans]|uniref:hypothetical protein n=1 Tax=Roseixanthobacter glucoisosaccharinicivorans TaxID=3119923 RepID=UPI003726E577